MAASLSDSFTKLVLKIGENVAARKHGTPSPHPPPSAASSSTPQHPYPPARPGSPFIMLEGDQEYQYDHNENGNDESFDSSSIDFLDSPSHKDEETSFGSFDYGQGGDTANIFNVYQSEDELESSDNDEAAMLENDEMRSHRGIPLTKEQFESYFDECGRLVNEHDLRKQIFKGGVDESIRRDVWTFLFELFPFNSTNREREVLHVENKVCYEAMKIRWKNILKNLEIDNDYEGVRYCPKWYTGCPNMNRNLKTHALQQNDHEDIPTFIHNDQQDSNGIMDSVDSASEQYTENYQQDSADHAVVTNSDRQNSTSTVTNSDDIETPPNDFDEITVALADAMLDVEDVRNPLSRHISDISDISFVEKPLDSEFDEIGVEIPEDERFDNKVFPNPFMLSPEYVNTHESLFSQSENIVSLDIDRLEKNTNLPENTSECSQTSDCLENNSNLPENTSECSQSLDCLDKKEMSNLPENTSECSQSLDYLDKEQNTNLPDNTSKSSCLQPENIIDRFVSEQNSNLLENNTPKITCLQPENIVSPNTDCLDNKQTTNLPENPSETSCLQPENIVSSDKDCLDKKLTINLPGSTSETSCLQPENIVSSDIDCLDTKQDSNLPGSTSKCSQSLDCLDNKQDSTLPENTSETSCLHSEIITDCLPSEHTSNLLENNTSEVLCLQPESNVDCLDSEQNTSLPDRNRQTLSLQSDQSFEDFLTSKQNTILPTKTLETSCLQPKDNASSEIDGTGSRENANLPTFDDNQVDLLCNTKGSDNDVLNGETLNNEAGCLNGNAHSEDNEYKIIHPMVTIVRTAEYDEFEGNDSVDSISFEPEGITKNARFLKDENECLRENYGNNMHSTTKPINISKNTINPNSFARLEDCKHDNDKLSTRYEKPAVARSPTGESLGGLPPWIAQMIRASTPTSPNKTQNSKVAVEVELDECHCKQTQEEIELNKERKELNKELLGIVENANKYVEETMRLHSGQNTPRESSKTTSPLQENNLVEDEPQFDTQLKINLPQQVDNVILKNANNSLFLSPLSKPEADVFLHHTPSLKLVTDLDDGGSTPVADGNDGIGMDPFLRACPYCSYEPETSTKIVLPASLGEDQLKFMEIQAQVFAARQPFEDKRIAESVRVIDKDVPRTDRELDMFQGNSNPGLLKLRDALLTYSFFHPEVGYAQGMNDIMARFLYVMNDEAEAYWMFLRYMEHFQNDFMEEGMLKKIAQVEQLLMKMDRELYDFLQSTDMGLIFCHRWLLLNFKREFEYNEAVRLFEITSSRHLEVSSLSAEIERSKERAKEFVKDKAGSHMEEVFLLPEYPFDVFLCVAMLEECRDMIMTTDDLSTVYMILSNLPKTLELQQILRKSEELFYRYCRKTTVDCFQVIDDLEIPDLKKSRLSFPFSFR